MKYRITKESLSKAIDGSYCLSEICEKLKNADKTLFQIKNKKSSIRI